MMNPIIRVLLLFTVFTHFLTTTIITVSSMSMTETTSRLVGSRLLVTGGGRGIGKAMAKICVEEGAKVAICSRTQSELEETIAEMKSIMTSRNKTGDIEKNVAMFRVDLLDKAQVQEMVSSIMDQWGNIDVLINNAGTSQKKKGPLHTLDGEDLQRVLNINLGAVHTVTSVVIQEWEKRQSTSEG